jgi:hypothetical protein
VNQSFQPPLAAALTPRRSRTIPLLVLLLAVLAALGAAVYGYLEQRRTERVLIAVRPVAYGQPITADDLGTIEVAYHRPAQLAGIADPALVIGKYSARAWTPNDLVQPAMLLATKPTTPVYPSGETLAPGLVAATFSTATVGPLTADDTLNVGFLDGSGDRDRCLVAGGAALGPVDPALPPRAADEASGAGETTGAGAPTDTNPPDALPEPYACRLLSNAPVLQVDAEAQLAYLALTPAQALALRAVQAAQLPLWGERYGAESPALPALDRLDPARISPAILAAPITATWGRAPSDLPTAPPATLPGAPSPATPTEPQPTLSAPASSTPATQEPTASPASPATSGGDR